MNPDDQNTNINGEIPPVNPEAPAPNPAESVPATPEPLGPAPTEPTPGLSAPEDSVLDVSTPDVSAPETPIEPVVLQSQPETPGETVVTSTPEAMPQPEPAPTPEPTADSSAQSSPFQSAPPEPAASPAAAAPTFVASAPAPAPEGAKKKKWLVIGGIIAAAVLLIGGGVALYFSLFHVSSSEYRAAEKQLSTVINAHDDILDRGDELADLISTSSDSRFNDKLSEAREATTKLKNENKVLSEMKAVRFGEGREYYKEFNDKLERYATYIEDLLTSTEMLRPINNVCKQASGSLSVATEVIERLRDCAEALTKGAKDFPNKDFGNFYIKLGDAYARYADVCEKILRAPVGSTQYDNELRDILIEIGELVESTDDILKDKEDARVRDEADMLREFFKNKQN